MNIEKAKELLLEILKPGYTVYLIRTNHGCKAQARYAILIPEIEDKPEHPLGHQITLRNISNLCAVVLRRTWWGHKGNESSINWDGQDVGWPIMGLSAALFDDDDRALQYELL